MYDYIKLFVTYEIALAMESIGFDEDCLMMFPKGKEYDGRLWQHASNGVKVPTWQQAFDWFRNVHNLHSWIRLDNVKDKVYVGFVDYCNDDGDSFEQVAKASHDVVREKLLIKMFDVVESKKEKV
jgi:hypothetical protein